MPAPDSVQFDGRHTAVRVREGGAYRLRERDPSGKVRQSASKCGEVPGTAGRAEGAARRGREVGGLEVMARSLNGFQFDVTHSADGETITVIASKDDHECKRTEVFRFAPDEARELIQLLTGAMGSAKVRRKAMRRAARADVPEATE